MAATIPWKVIIMNFARHHLLLAASLLSPTVHAHKPTPGAITEAPPVIVTANPLGSSLLDMVQPADVLSGAKLGLRMESTLGETLANETGVSSSYFGPSSSRPIIRGLDGERVRILQNGVGVLDASGASPDHGVALDPLIVDRIEIVRGPSALLYGASAVGGVINTIDNRIPTAPGDTPMSGTAQLRYGGAGEEIGGVAKLDGGNERFALHVDAFKRETWDVRIPGFARSQRLRDTVSLAPGEQEPYGRLPNSASSSVGGSVGGSMFFDRGFLGLSAATYNSTYGVVAEPTVSIGMRQNRYDLSGELRELGVIESAKLKATYTDYQHTEYDVTNPGTLFSNKGYETRADFRHRRIGLVEGAFGVQASDTRFQALGDEAFVPPVTTKVLSGFVYEELPVGPVRFSAGGRLDSVKLSAEQYLPNFSPAESRNFITGSGSLGALLPLDAVYAIATNLAYTERAPNYVEVFANGPHAATGQFEVGNRSQKLERSTAIDLSLRKRSGVVTASIGAFYNQFDNFIALLPTGLTDAGSALPIVRFEGVKATLKGIEAEARWHVLDTPDRTFHLDFRTDYTRAENDSTNQPLPRISPLRVSLAAVYQGGGLGARLEVVRASSQTRVAANELPTDGYTLLNGRLSYALPPMQFGRLEAFVRLNNLLNEEIRYHTSVLKDIAPLGGRSVMVGLSGTF